MPGRWRNKRIIVLGDMILDEFIFGRTDRVSREAPVVIVRYDGSSYSPGGAANAAQNIAALGGRAVPVGLIGDDAEGAQLRSLMKERGIATRGLVRAAGRMTTTKTRVMAGDYHAQRQQIIRIDREEESHISAALSDRILAAFDRELEKADAVVLSDYQQGLFDSKVIRESIRGARKRRIPVVADSRFRLARFKGVTAATPNEVEAAEAAGVDLAGGASLERLGKKLLEMIGASSLLVTRGRFGMALFEPGRKSRRIGVVGKPEATDVTGAGDTVVSAVALTLAAGGEMTAAMHLANIAASIVVMKRGTAVAEIPEVMELIHALEEREEV
jgi:rfaE bifunctional protein kinase chain/domain